MIQEVIAVGLIVTAFLAVYLERAVYSVLSLAGTMILASIFYAIVNAYFAAIFQLAVGVGMIAVLFLSSEMLSEKKIRKKSFKRIAMAIGGALVIAVPTVFLSFNLVSNPFLGDVSFSRALWNLRTMDVVVQGLVMLMVAMGIAIVIYDKKEGGEK